MKKPNAFYYIAHVSNLRSILELGILSHEEVIKQQLASKSIYDEKIVSKRKDKTTPADLSLWAYANVYFQARNPMLYRVLHEESRDSIMVLQISPDIFAADGAFITDGNAAGSQTIFHPANQNGLKMLDAKIFKRNYWSENDDSKRKIMAELLIPKMIPAGKITSIYVATEEAQLKVEKISKSIQAIVQPESFFLPAYQKKLSESISLAKGDMFFSNMQTLSISVNTVGIMGKGLASRAKYQFPDVYVAYQDACRNKALKMGKPFLYKRGGNVEKSLADNPETLETENGERWFLLFPTKDHWRNPSPLGGIEEGLQWLVKNCEKEGVQSLAIPALGCGLGGLEWEEVGPLMCRYLSQLPTSIRSRIYLPVEKDTPEEHLSEKFLLG